jgi:hypothetical protein
MPEDSTTPDPVELVRLYNEVVRRRDFDSAMSFWGSDPVWDTTPVGLGLYEGPAAIRGFIEDWIGDYQDWVIEEEELVHLGNGISFAVYIQTGRPAGSVGEVQARYAAVGVWVERLQVRVTNYAHIDEARAAAERLAEERR